MKNALLLVVGVGIGFVAAHQISRTPRGQRFFAAVNDKAQAFGAVVAEGYSRRETELRAAIAGDAPSASGRHTD